jgi:hypothetical protein
VVVNTFNLTDWALQFLQQMCLVVQCHEAWEQLRILNLSYSFYWLIFICYIAHHSVLYYDCVYLLLKIRKDLPFRVLGNNKRQFNDISINCEFIWSRLLQVLPFIALAMSRVSLFKDHLCPHHQGLIHSDTPVLQSRKASPSLWYTRRCVIVFSFIYGLCHLFWLISHSNVTQIYTVLIYRICRFITNVQLDCCICIIIYLSQIITSALWCCQWLKSWGPPEYL